MNSRQVGSPGMTDRGGSTSSSVRSRCASIAMLVIVMTAASVWAVPGPQLNAGSLDPRFGAEGKVLTDFRAAVSSDGQAVAVQPDGKIVVAATVQDAPGRRFGLTRYDSDGTLDQDFGTNGMITTSPSLESVSARPADR